MLVQRWSIATGTRRATVQDVRSLRALAEERKLKHYVCVSLEARPRRVDGVRLLPVREFLDALWSGEYA